MQPINSNQIPRLKGRVGEIEPGQGHDGKWAFEIHFCDISGKSLGEPFTAGPYETEKEALKEIKGALKFCCEEFEKKTTGQVSGKFFDMNQGGIVRSWEEH